MEPVVSTGHTAIPMASEVDRLIQRLRGGEGHADETVRALVAALKRQGAAADGVIRELLADAHELLRWAAVLACEDRTKDELAPVAEALAPLAHDSYVRVRRALAELARELPDGLSQATLDQLIHDEESAVREPAVARAAGLPRYVDRIIELLTSDDAWDVREAAAEALKDNHEPAATAALLQALSDDDDLDVSKAAAITLEEQVQRGVSLSSLPVGELTRARERISSGRLGRKPKLLEALEREIGDRADVDALGRFGQDLTQLLEQDKISRGHDVDGLVDAICAAVTGSGVRSAVLVGPSGTGKTAIVHEAAARLAEMSPPWRIIRVSAADILAGTVYLGEWQTKVRDLVAAVRAPRRVVLYVPNLEELSGAGRTRDSTENVATALAPYIEDGSIALLGETTPEMWQSGLGGVGSLRRLFTRVDVSEADPERTRRVLECVRDASETEVSNEVLGRLTELADYFLAGIAQPGRAVGLLRRTLDRVPASRAVEVDDVLDTLSLSTGVPRQLLDDRAPLDPDAVRSFFEARVMGQTEALDAVVDLVTLVKAGLTDPDKPFGVHLFVGPTGVGKTALARALAEYLFGNASRMVRLDMSEYASYEGFQRLLGVGASQGTLTGPVQEHPFSVVLLDEIEKSHVNVYDLCLQLFDAGRLTDGSGRTIDFRRTIIIMTSNVGAAVGLDPGLGFGADDAPAHDRERTMRELARTFRPEFLNRLDRIVAFQPLSLEVAERIARREVSAVLERSGIQRRHLIVDVDPRVIARLLEEGYSARFGARPLNRTVERMVLLPLARSLAAGRVKDRSVLRLSVEGKRIGVRVTPPEDEPDEVGGSPPEAHVLRARTDGLRESVDAILDAAGPLRDKRSELLRMQESPGFWNDRAKVTDVLDRMRRFDDVIAAVEELDRASQRLSAWASARDFSEGLDRFEDRLAELETEAVRLAELVRCRDELDLADAFVCVDLVASRGEGLDGVGKLAGMYRALGRRRGFEIEVVDDRKGTGSDDGLVLLISGGGAHALLTGETGHHEVIRRSGGGRDRDDRDVVRVSVLPAPVGHESPEFASEVSVTTTRVRDARGRLIPNPEIEVELFHEPSKVGVRGRCAAPKDAAIEQLRLLLRARVEARHGGDASRLVRRYVLGAAPRVRDIRTGIRTGRLDRVLDGRIDRFLVRPRDDS